MDIVGYQECKKSRCLRRPTCRKAQARRLDVVGAFSYIQCIPFLSHLRALQVTHAVTSQSFLTFVKEEPKQPKPKQPKAKAEPKSKIPPPPPPPSEAPMRLCCFIPILDLHAIAFRFQIISSFFKSLSFIPRSFSFPFQCSFDVLIWFSFGGRVRTIGNWVICSQVSGLFVHSLPQH